MAKRMQFLDVCWNVLQWMDNKCIKKIYLLGLVPSLSELSNKSMFWHSRVETVTGKRVPFSSEVNWKVTYQILCRELKTSGPSLYNEYDNVLASRLLYDMGRKASMYDQERCVDSGCANILSFLLSRHAVQRVRISQTVAHLLQYAVKTHQNECVAVLLRDGRTIPRHNLLYQCESREDVLTLAADRRLNLAAECNSALLHAIKLRRVAVVEALLLFPSVLSCIHLEIRTVASLSSSKEIRHAISACP